MKVNTDSARGKVYSSFTKDLRIDKDSIIPYEISDSKAKRWNK